MIRSVLVNLFFISLVFAKTVSVNSFKVEDTPIKEVAQMLAKLTNRGLLINPFVRGKITLELKGELTGEQLWDIFSRALAQMGYTVRYEPKQNLVVIEPISNAEKLIHPKGEYAGEYSLLVFKLNYLSPNTVYSTVRNLLSPYGRLLVLNNFGILIVTDFSHNLEFIKSFLNEIDKPQYKQTLQVYRFKYISPKDFERAIKPYLYWYKAQKKFSIYITYIEDKKLLIVSAPEEFQKKLQYLQKILDKPYNKKEEKLGFHILKLRYTSVDEVEKTITNLFNKISKKK